jgi:hypothetical protein
MNELMNLLPLLFCFGLLMAVFRLDNKIKDLEYELGVLMRTQKKKISK